MLPLPHVMGCIIPTNETKGTYVPTHYQKYLGEMSCFHWHKVYGVPVNSIRIFNAYGTRVRTTVHMEQFLVF